MYPLEIRQESGHEFGIGLEVSGVLFIFDDVLVESMPNVQEVVVVQSLVETVLDHTIRRYGVLHDF